MLLSLIAIGIALYAIGKLNNLSRRIDELQPKKLPVASSNVNIQEPIKEKQVSLDSKSSTETSGPSFIENFFKWYAHEWTLKTGALFILLGFVWLVSYAFLNNWIGPVGRITLGLLIGAGILIGGELRMRTVKTQGITLSWLGASIMVVTIYSAQTFYHMFPSLIALLFTMVIMVATTFISLKHRSYSLAIASLVVAALAPLIIVAGEKNIFSLYSYLFIIVIGVLWVVRFSGWRSLTIFSLGIVTFYSMEYFIQGFSQHYYTYRSYYPSPLELLELRTFAAVFASLFYFASLLPIITERRATNSDLIMSFAVGFFTLAWINALVPPEYKGLITLIAALFYAGGAFMVFTKTGLKEAVYVYTGVATVLLAVATVFEFSGPTLVIAFSVQALLLPIIAVSVLGTQKGKWMLAFLILPIYTSLPAITSYEWETGIFNNSFYSLFAVTSCLLLSGLYFYYIRKDIDEDLKKSATAVIVGGSSYALLLLWKVNHAVVSSDDTARMITLFIYTIIGLGAYMTGQIQKRKVLYWFGLILLIGVIGRLLLVEVWQMVLVGRIITFFSVGILLIGSVLLRKNQLAPQKT